MRPRALEGEEPREHWFANHARGQMSIGGTLWLTPSRLVFVPNPLERMLRRAHWVCDLASITNVDVADREMHPFNGGLRRRLLVARGAENDLFVVNHVETIMAAIDQVRAAHNCLIDGGGVGLPSTGRDGSIPSEPCRGIRAGRRRGASGCTIDDATRARGLTSRQYR